MFHSNNPLKVAKNLFLGLEKVKMSEVLGAREVIISTTLWLIMLCSNMFHFMVAQRY